MFCGVVSAQAREDAPVKIDGSISLVYDDNVFAYSQKIQDFFRVAPTRLFFRNQNVKSLSDIITNPSFRLGFYPQRYPSTDISAELYGSLYRQNSSLNDRGYFIKITQGLGQKTDISMTYNELFSEFNEETFQTVGVDLRHDFRILEGNIVAEKTNDDKYYGVSLAKFIENRYFGITLSYQFDQEIPNDIAFALMSHQLRIEPSFPVTDTLFLNLYVNIQKEQYTNDVREDRTLELGFLMDYEIQKHFSAQLGFDRIFWNTDKQIENASYEKKVITVHAVVSF